MSESLAKCFNRLQETKPVYRDHLDITMLLEKSEVSPIESTKKSKCLQRAKKIEITKPLAQKEGLKPRKVVRFQLENNEIIEPKKDTKDEKPLDEEEGLDKVVRVKIKMTKQEARKLLLKCKNGNVLDYEHVVEYIRAPCYPI